jgi:hypothetical protein
MRKLTIVLALAALACAACDQTDQPAKPPAQTNSKVKVAPATRVAPAATSEGERADSPSATTTASSGDPVADCKAASAAARANPGDRNAILRDGCGPIIGNATCREAIGGDHATFWQACVDAYCPQFEEEGRKSVFCEMDGGPTERADTLPFRAAFLTDAVLMDRGLDAMPQVFHDKFAAILDTPAESRQTAMKNLMADILKSDAITTEQKEIWSIATILAIVEPISPPLQIGNSGAPN